MDYIKLLELGMKPCQHICWTMSFKEGKLTKPYSSKGTKQKKDGIFISQDKYVGEILKKFGFTEVKTASTPMETQKPLLKDEDGEEVDVHMYRSMIGSLMYSYILQHDNMFGNYVPVLDTKSIQSILDVEYSGSKTFENESLQQEVANSLEVD
ncbi:hypothetical protein Tco_0758306 [Tanacetum coccineum]